MEFSLTQNAMLKSTLPIVRDDVLALVRYFPEDRTRRAPLLIFPAAPLIVAADSLSVLADPLESALAPLASSSFQ
mgnify:CR=1 FL=1